MIIGMEKINLISITLVDSKEMPAGTIKFVWPTHPYGLAPREGDANS